MSYPQTASEAREAFTSNSIEFKEHSVLSNNFSGTRFVFNSRKAAREVELLVGPNAITRYHNDWSVQYFT